MQLCARLALFYNNEAMMEAEKLAEAWQQIRKGDVKAYEWLFKQLASRLYGYGYRIVADRPTVQDAVQDLFVQLWENRESLSDVKLVKPYLYKSIRSRLLRSLGQPAMQEDAVFEAIAVPHHEELLIAQEHDHEMNQKLLNCLAKLTPRQREMIYLKFYQQLDYDEIANILNMIYQAAVNLCFRAISGLRNCLKT